MAVVYKHIRLDNNEVFYIGMGTEARSRSKTGRNKYWTNIVNKCGYKVEITHRGLIKEEAAVIEKYLIAFYGRKDLGLGNLVNMSDGGEGCINQSPETRKLRSVIMLGDNNHRYGKQLTYNQKRYLSDLWKGKIFSAETKRKLSNRSIGNKRGAKRVIDTANGVIYDSLNEAAFASGISATYLSLKLNNRVSNKTTLKYL